MVGGFKSSRPVEAEVLVVDAGRGSSPDNSDVSLPASCKTKDYV